MSDLELGLTDDEVMAMLNSGKSLTMVAEFDEGVEFTSRLEAKYGVKIERLHFMVDGLTIFIRDKVDRHPLENLLPKG